MTTVEPPEPAGRWPISRCTSADCEAPMVWARTVKGSRIPMDAQPSPAGRYRLQDRGGPEPFAVYVKPTQLGQPDLLADPEPLHTSHFATCPAAARFRFPR